MTDSSHLRGSEAHGCIGPLEVELPRELTAARRARRLLDELSEGMLDRAALDTAKLLVTELVNNAVVHGEGTITFRASLDDDRLHVEVIDEGSGFERAVRDSDLAQIGGWGLHLVEAESDRWGVHDGPTHVWVEIEQPGPRLGAAANPLGSDPD